MARGKGTINKVTLIGRLGADPQLRYTPSGRASATFNIATNYGWKDNDGNPQERTDWHRIVAWGKLAEIMGEWLKKGSLVYLDGRLQTRNYEDNGVKKYITEVVVTDMEMLGRKGESGGSGGSEPLPEEPPVIDQNDDLPF
ncbi:single-stranded DNA-binding protein [bacterium]|nr:single-stranded DNA-binding protein [bacterium]